MLCWVCLWVRWGVCGMWLGQKTYVALGTIFKRTKVQLLCKLLVFKIFSNALVG
jgi:hypothetical protein